jgi:hypothetical protein
LWAGGLRNVNMYADFTVNRDGHSLCEDDRRNLKWDGNSRVDFVDLEMPHHGLRRLADRQYRITNERSGKNVHRAPPREIARPCTGARRLAS